MIKVLIVDDSALIRQLMQEILSSDPEIQVVGTAPDPHVAQKKILQLEPDVITLDLEMPHMDGLSFLELIMRQNPLPVVVVSGQTQKGAEKSLRSLELGAFDVVAKPNLDIQRSWPNISQEIVSKVKGAAASRYFGDASVRFKQKIPDLSIGGANRVIAIGASTGGVMALKTILFNMPTYNCLPVLICQHFPAGFAKIFAERMDRQCGLKVSLATQNTRIEAGNVYLAPSDQNFRVARSGSHLICKLHDPEPALGITPSVNALFSSVAKYAGKDAIGVILTGMGKDGADGLLDMRQAGATTIGQDQASCMIYGMPKAAFEIGAVQTQMSLSQIAECLRGCVEMYSGAVREFAK